MIHLSHGSPSLHSIYDDPNRSYSTGKPMDWDEKRREWLKLHTSFAATPANDRILAVTGSQPKACKSCVGDHLILGMFKNKVYYCRIHSYDIFYNNVLFHPQAAAPGPKTRFSMLQCWLTPRPSGSWSSRFHLRDTKPVT